MQPPYQKLIKRSGRVMSHLLSTKVPKTQSHISCKGSQFSSLSRGSYGVNVMEIKLFCLESI